MKSRTAVPSRRNSGQDTYATPGARRMIASPVPTGTVLFMTSTRSDAAEISSAARITTERSASPECVGGVCTQTNSNRAASITRSISVVKVSRSAFLRISSARPGSWNGSSPASSASIFSATYVPHVDGVTELREAGGGDEADPACADHTYGLALVQARILSARPRRCGAMIQPWPWPRLGSSAMPFAISSISRSDSDCASVLETQKEPSSVCHAIMRTRSPS